MLRTTVLFFGHRFALTVSSLLTLLVPMLRRSLLLMAVLSLPAVARGQAVTWKIDPGHTSAQFAVRHMLVATVRGVFDGPGGTVAFDPKDIPGTLKVEATFNTKSIDTRNAERD